MSEYKGGHLDWFSIAVSVAVTVFLIGGAWLFYSVTNEFEAAFGEPSQYYTLAQRGQIGDYLGGKLNSSFAFFSFMALLVTILLQTWEMRLTRREMAEFREAAQMSAHEAEKANTLAKMNASIQARSLWVDVHAQMLDIREKWYPNELPAEEDVILKWKEPPSGSVEAAEQQKSTEIYRAYQEQYLMLFEVKEEIEEDRDAMEQFETEYDDSD